MPILPLVGVFLSPNAYGLPASVALGSILVEATLTQISTLVVGAWLGVDAVITLHAAVVLLVPVLLLCLSVLVGYD